MARGDLILFESDGSLGDRMIVWATKGRFTHIEIDLGDGTTIGALSNGIVIHPYPTGRGTVEVSPKASKENIEYGLKWALKQVGKKYGWTDIGCHPDCCGRVESKQAEKQSRKPTQEVVASGKKRKTPSPSRPPSWLVLDSCSIVHCPFLSHHWVYSTGTFLNRMPSIVAQTMVRQLISVVNTSI